MLRVRVGRWSFQTSKEEQRQSRRLAKPREERTGMGRTRQILASFKVWDKRSCAPWYNATGNTRGHLRCDICKSKEIKNSTRVESCSSWNSQFTGNRAYGSCMTQEELISKTRKRHCYRWNELVSSTNKWQLKKIKKRKKGAVLNWERLRRSVNKTRCAELHWTMIQIHQWFWDSWESLNTDDMQKSLWLFLGVIVMLHTCQKYTLKYSWLNLCAVQDLL